jgi:pimeloyl-ACP methyl ester carboxylesterase
MRILPFCLSFLLLARSSTFGQEPSEGSTSSRATVNHREQSVISRHPVQEIIANNRKIVSSYGVERLVALRINGIEQWLSIRGRDSRNPILLFLHGGPGSPTMPVDYTFQSPWEDYFTVVQWDQRGTGKTYASGPKQQAPLTIDQMTSDAEKVSEYLLETYGKKKIFLLGHSWGSVLGVALVQRHPEWFYAYIGVGQIINMQKSEAEGYDFALNQAGSDHNLRAVRELKAIAPYPGAPGTLSFKSIGVQRKWLMYYGGLTWRRKDFKWDADAWLLSPDYSSKDLEATEAGSVYSVSHLLAPLQLVNYGDVTTFRCPVFLFEGRHDYAVSHTLVMQWFHRVNAPEKKLIWLEDAAHMVMEEEPGRFLFHLLTDVRPTAARAGDAAPDESLE